MNLSNICTDRLILVPVTLEITHSLMSGNSKVIEELGYKTDIEWPTADTKDILPIINRTLERDNIPSGFEFWMIVKKENMHVIGDIGFYGKPNENGEVEIGYGLVKNERSKGYGFEALKVIMDWLSFQECVKVLKADCLISNAASTRILEKVGMNEIFRNQEYIFWEYKFTNQ